MMLKALFSASRDLSPAEVRQFMETRRPDQYTLLDVRQPAEYKRGHIPGARLIPLPDLSERLGELDPGRPTIAYCALGGRSRAAAEMLKHRGFAEVYSLAGGITAWDGLTAPGAPTQGLGLVTGREDRARLLVIALGLEAGLGDFYRQAGQRAAERRTRELCQRLAQVERRHLEQVHALYLWERPDGPNLEELVGQARELVMEGGEKVDQALERRLPPGFGERALLETAMGIEAQALDLYLRMSFKLAQDPARQALYDLAQEERAHLKALGQLLERLSREDDAPAG